MITGVIDLGTNTFNLLIKDELDRLLYNDKIPVKLGKGGIDKNHIAADAFQRGIDALTRFRDICKEKDADQIFAFATSAVRSADNGDKFVEEVEEQTGIKVNVIDGDREAMFIYEGVNQAIQIGKEPVLIVDIGGGSTECVIANHTGVLWEESYPLGVSRLLETFKPKDPIQKEDIRNLEDHFDSTLADLWQAVQLHKPTTMVGSSGSFETIHDVCAKQFGHAMIEPEQKNSRIYLRELEVASELLINGSTTERTVIPGMVTMRADTIHLSAIQINFLLKKTRIKTLLLSMYALKEGVLYSMNKEHEPWLTSSL